MDDKKEEGKYVEEVTDNNQTVHTGTQVDEEKEEELNPGQVVNGDLKTEKSIDSKGLDEFPIENQGPVDSAVSTLKTTNDTSMAANELTDGKTGTDISDVLPSNRLQPDPNPKSSMEAAPGFTKKDNDIEGTDGNDLNPYNQPPIAPHESSMKVEAKYDEKKTELNVGMSHVELSPNRENKEQVPKLKLDIGHEVPMKSSEQSFHVVPDGVEGYDSGTEEEQVAFTREVENFCKENSLEFKPQSSTKKN